MPTDAVLTCCRDEADIIGTFVLFYLELGFDAVYVVDNSVGDETAAVVRKLIAAGLPVTLHSDNRTGYERHLTEWFKTAGEFLNPRWLFFLDCDEFILLPRPAREWLDGFPSEINRLILRQREVYPAADESASSHFLLSRRTEPQFNDTTKDMVRFDPGAHVYGGKHRIDIPSPRTLCPTDVFIRHYKYRTAEQARRKEQNRMLAKRVYTDADLARISSTGVDSAREWISHCERAADEELWRESFAPVSYAEDDVMANWAEAFLQRVCVPA